MGGVKRWVIDCKKNMLSTGCYLPALRYRLYSYPLYPLYPLYLLPMLRLPGSRRVIPTLIRIGSADRWNS
jgi:hypothetical protein